MPRKTIKVGWFRSGRCADVRHPLPRAGCNPREDLTLALVVQLDECWSSKPEPCGFDPHREHQSRTMWVRIPSEALRPCRLMGKSSDLCSRGEGGYRTSLRNWNRPFESVREHQTLWGVWKYFFSTSGISILVIDSVARVQDRGNLNLSRYGRSCGGF